MSNKLKITYKETNFFSKLIIDYIERNDSLRNNISYFPNLDNFSKQIQKKSKQNLNRKLLVNVLKQQNSKISLSNFSKKNIELLSRKNTYTVTTGHQLCLFTGPLFFIYKIFSTINLVEKLAKKYPKNNFVPLFWLASEDHDLNEINHFNLNNKVYTYNKKVKKNTPVGRLIFDEIEQFISDNLTEFLQKSNDGKNLLKIFKKAYRNDKSLADCTRVLINELFGSYGLIIIDGDDKYLKSSFKNVIKKDVLDQYYAKYIKMDSERLLEKSYHQQAHYRDINFFRIKDGRRELILNSNNLGKDEIDNFPQNFSPNVLIRPIYQELVLPNIAIVGGGSEISYWLQLKSSFEKEKIPLPMLILRNSVMILSKHQINKIKKLNLSVKDFFYNTEYLHKKYILNKINTNFSFNEQKKKINEIYYNIKSVFHDLNLDDSINANLKKNLKLLSLLESKLIRNKKKFDEDSINQITKIKNELFPNNKLQERNNNFMTYYMKYGDNFFKILKNNLDPLDSNFVVLQK
tara:strand:+ start:43974 stop:45527 length:1554 start_codon:yes stop_codon:yes gene_type:complete